MPHSFGAYLILYIMVDLFNYTRRASSVAHIGAIDLGGDNPIRIQSMTTTNTNDTEACVLQAEEIIKAGGELVRFTTQGSREAENMKNINAGIRADGYQTPLVADVHFNPNVADVAALYCEKVRVNPGNYVDPARKFIKQEYTDEEYAHELQKIEDRFVPFLNICKEHHTAIRIGVNHGSLSDRIRNRYGDTPEGIVESCLEFLRICKKENFHDVVISIKSSNTYRSCKPQRGTGCRDSCGTPSGRLHRQEEGASDDSCRSLSFIRLAAPYPPRNRGCRQYRRQQRSGSYQQPNQRREHRL